MELVARESTRGDMLSYERLLGDALRGDASLFTRDDCVEAAWAVVQPVLNEHSPAEPYEPGTWGPAPANRLIVNGRWHDPQFAAPTTPAA